MFIATHVIFVYILWDALTSSVTFFVFFYINTHNLYNVYTFTTRYTNVLPYGMLWGSKQWDLKLGKSHTCTKHIHMICLEKSHTRSELIGPDIKKVVYKSRFIKRFIAGEKSFA